MVDTTLSQERCDFYVYVIFRPTGEPCYVGKGRGGRWQEHVKRSHNKQLSDIYARAGGDLPVIKVRQGMTNANACATEIAFIAALGRLDLGTGVLINLTDGGEGTAGKKLTGDSLAKIRSILLERNAAMKGKPHSAEHNAKIAAAGKGRQATPETRERLSQALTGIKKKPISPEHKAKISAANTGKQVSAETRAKMAEATRRSMSDPETRARIISAAAEARAKLPLSEYAISRMAMPSRGSPEHVAKVVAFHKGRKRSPETCAKISAALRGKKRTDEQRAALSDARRGVPKSEAHREKMRARMLGERNPMYGKRKVDNESDDRQLTLFRQPR